MGVFSSTKKVKLSTEDQEKVDQYTSCFTGPAADFVIADLYFLTGLPTSVFNDADYDPIRAAHRDGMQTVLKRILNYSGRTIYKP